METILFFFISNWNFFSYLFSIFFARDSKIRKTHSHIHTHTQCQHKSQPNESHYFITKKIISVQDLNRSAEFFGLYFLLSSSDFNFIVLDPFSVWRMNESTRCRSTCHSYAYSDSETTTTKQIQFCFEQWNSNETACTLYMCFIKWRTVTCVRVFRFVCVAIENSIFVALFDSTVSEHMCVCDGDAIVYTKIFLSSSLLLLIFICLPFCYSWYSSV